MDKTLNYERYNRQMILKGFGTTAQQKLSAAKVLVIGAGGLGCPALQYLVASGVGVVGIADDDVVTLSNLHRQILYTTDDIGLHKVEAAHARLSRSNPDISILLYHLRLDATTALNIIRQYDFVIDGTDNFTSRYLINDACVLLNKPLIYGAVSQYQGQVAVFNVGNKNNQATKYRDLFPHPPEDSEVPNCAEAGVLGVLPGIIGTMQAAEAIKLITGIGKPLQNNLLTYDVLTNEMYVVTITPSTPGKDLSPKNEAEFLAMDYSEVCSTKENDVLEIDIEQFHALSKENSAIVIDVRERGELPHITSIEHLQIPMSVFSDTVSKIKEQTIVIFCQHGIRSLYAAEMLLEEFGATKNVYSLKGGIVRWGVQLGNELSIHKTQ